MKNSQAAKVLVIGAGPTGLTLSACLKKFGVPVDVIDAKKGPNTQSKALAINPIAQVQLDLIFGKNQVGKSANPVTKLNIVYDNNKRLNTIDLKYLHWPIDTMLVQTQQETELELLDLAEQNDISINWETKATHVEESENSASVVFENNINEIFEKEYDYIIGCEGKHSIVRESIGTKMEHQSYSMYLALADFELNTDLSENSAHYFVYEDTFFVFVPLGEKIWRIVVKHDGSPEKGEHINLVTDKVIEKFGRDIFVGDYLWFSQAPLYVSYADKLQSERLYIAGDSAHLYSPLGGTGMNTGITDAINLAWKLAYKINGYTSGDKLISSYGSERIPAIKENAIATDHLTKLISRQLKDTQHISAFMPKMSNRHVMRNVFPLNISGLGLKYKNGFLDQENIANNEVGQMNSSLISLLSNITKLKLEEVPAIKIFQFIDSSFDQDSAIIKNNTAFRGVNTILVYWYPDDTSTDDIKKENNLNNTTSDAYRIAIKRSNWLDLTSCGTLQAVRPDGIILFRGDKSEYHILDQILNEHLDLHIN